MLCMVRGDIMSKMGRKPIPIPDSVDVKIDGNLISVKGPKGYLTYSLPEVLDIQIHSKSIVVTRRSDANKIKALHGLVRTLISNMVTGVTQGFTKTLQIHGVGYKAEVRGDKLILSVGYSHPVEFALPEGIKATVDEKQTTVTLHGIDKQLVGQISANLRAIRPPDPYKGKGIRYTDEVLKLKHGKTGKK